MSVRRLQLRPHVIVTYNGDAFDWPYVDTRCSLREPPASLVSGLCCSAWLPPHAV